MTMSIKIVIINKDCFFTNINLYITLNVYEELVIYSSFSLLRDNYNEDTCMCAYKYTNISRTHIGKVSRVILDRNVTSYLKIIYRT